MIGVIGLLEEFRGNLDEKVEKRKTVREDNPYDMPVTKDRMHYSFIWDRYTLFETEDALIIDPADSRFNH